MEQNHPIPQHISSYQFRLVGDMTLKQFFQLAGGAVVSLLFYASPLHPLIKWPAILFFSLLGVALAFLPFEERPLEKWIAAFFLSVYSPTEFVWKREEQVPKFFKDELPETSTPLSPKEVEMKNYLGKATNLNSAFFSKLEDSEKSFLSKLASLLSGSAPLAEKAPERIVQPTETTKKEAIKPPQSFVAEETQAPSVPNIQAPAEVGPTQPPLSQNASPQAVNPLFANESAKNIQQVRFSPEAAPPNPPTYPNIIVGQVLTPEGKIVDGAIIEIRDSAGRPVRALKSNRVGHFMIATPLLSGIYQIITEKDGLAFEPVAFKAEGAIIPPIEITSHHANVTQTQPAAQII